MTEPRSTEPCLIADLLERVGEALGSETRANNVAVLLGPGVNIKRSPGVAAGLDLEMPSSAGVNDALVVAAVRAGELDEADVDLAVGRLLHLIDRAAPALADPGSADLDTHHSLAREVATRTAVLLKNDGVLPLAADRLADVVVIGEMARTPRYQGAGSSLVNPTKLVSALDALAERGLDLPFAPGYSLVEAAGKPGQEADGTTLREEAARLAQGKTAVLFLGLPAADESEGYDRSHMHLPASHTELLHAVRAVADRTVVLLSNGSSVTVSDWDDDADAVVELWLGGQAGGAAAVDLLLGEVAPSGRLAESIPARLSDVAAQLNFPGADGFVRYGEGVFVGYRGLDAMGIDVPYPFGHGLTYTTFDYSGLTLTADEVTAETQPGDVVARVAVTVTNTGDVAGAAVPQVYVGRPGSTIARPPRELRGFRRVMLAPRESRLVELTLTRRDLCHWDSLHGGWATEPGPLTVWIGESSRDLRASTTVELVAPRRRVQLTGDSTIEEWLANPAAGAAMIEALGEFGKSLTGGPDAATFLYSMPLGKVPIMGMTADFTQDDLDALVARVADL